MKTSKQMKWSVALMLVTMVMFLPSIMNFFTPGLFVDIYLQNDAGMTIAALAKTQEGVASIILLGFQGMGFTIIGYHMFAWPMILIPFKKAEKWAWITVGVTQLWLWIVNFVLEMKHSGSSFIVAYSVFAILAILLSLIISYRTVFSK